MTRKQLIAAALALALFLAAGWFPAAARAETASVSYIDGNGVERTADNVTVLNEFTDYEDLTELEAGWYAVTEYITVSGPIFLRDTVHLILCDDADINVDDSIVVCGEAYIYGQREGTGALTAKGTRDQPGISVTESSTVITINGGIIKAEGGKHAAGIGGGKNCSSGSVIINGGQVKAIGGEGGAGIGGGYRRNGGDVIIRGGYVHAKGTKYGTKKASAIGRGAKGSKDGTLTLVNMMVTYSIGTPEVQAQGREETCRKASVHLESCEPHHCSDDGACIYCSFREKESEPMPNRKSCHASGRIFDLYSSFFSFQSSFFISRTGFSKWVF